MVNHRLNPAPHNGHARARVSHHLPKPGQGAGEFMAIYGKKNGFEWEDELVGGFNPSEKY